MSYSSLGAQLWHMLTSDHAVLPATRTSGISHTCHATTLGWYSFFVWLRVGGWVGLGCLVKYWWFARLKTVNHPGICCGGWVYLQLLLHSAPQKLPNSVKKMQNKGHYTVQGHSRSAILIPIESWYMTSYYWLILTYLLSCTVSKI